MQAQPWQMIWRPVNNTNMLWQNENQWSTNLTMQAFIPPEKTRIEGKYVMSDGVPFHSLPWTLKPVSQAYLYASRGSSYLNNLLTLTAVKLIPGVLAVFMMTFVLILLCGRPCPFIPSWLNADCCSILTPCDQSWSLQRRVSESRQNRSSIICRACLYEAKCWFHVTSHLVVTYAWLLQPRH